MEKLNVYFVDAFADKMFGGNPAGVVLSQEKLSNDQMQNIAKELNLSETAFVVKSNNEDYHFDVKYFSPTNEVDFCGHATVGASWIIANKLGYYPKYSKLLLNTNIGIVPIEWNIEEDKLIGITMTQAKPQTKSIDISLEETASLLGINKDDIDTNYPLALGYSGNWHFIVPINNMKAIDNAKPDLEKLSIQNKKHNCITTHLYTFNVENNNFDIYTRDFGPAIGIDEDPVTGSANGALCALLIEKGVLDRSKNHNLLIWQTNSSNRPGMLSASIIKNNDSFDIKIGGKAIISLEGTIAL